MDHAQNRATRSSRLANRRILVIGGGQDSHGVEDPPVGNGRAISITCAREGAAVAVADLVLRSAEETAALVRKEGTKAIALAGDASVEGDVVAMMDTAERELGGLDGLVLNVGVGAGLGLQNTSVADWDRVLAVNLRAHFLGVKHGLPRLAAGGSAVLIGSLAGMKVMPFPAYSASKAALEALSRHAAIEAAPDVRVNLLVPGLIDTPLGRMSTRLNPSRAETPVPLGRQGTAREVANAALFLLSDEASYITAATLVVDGGLNYAARLPLLARSRPRPQKETPT
jgi:NAD(P)-dependent dehydrogenase (short-subunit alcohol dehydrogenase family)